MKKKLARTLRADCGRGASRHFGYRSRAAVPEQADPHRRRVCRRRPERRRGAHHRAEAHREMGPAGDRRHPSRRRRQYRHRDRGESAARRLHAARAGVRACGQSVPVSKAAVRRGEGLRAHPALRVDRQRARRAPVDSRALGERADRVRENAPRPAYAGLRRQRHRIAPRGRTAEHDGRHQDHARAVQRAGTRRTRKS